MERLILTTDVSSAGRIKASRIADRVIGPCQRLIEGPLPSEADNETFFGFVQLEDNLQDDPHHWQSWIGLLERQRLGTSRPSFAQTCHEYDQIEVWIAPVPNAYLILLQLVEALQSHPDVLARVLLAFPTQFVGDLSEAEFGNTRPLAHRITPAQLDLASRAWHAHTHETPEAWFKLLHEDLYALPGFRQFVLRVLAELPSAINGLGASEAQLIALVGSKNANHSTVFTRYLRSKPRPTLDYWEAGQRIVSLSRCEPPIIDGVDEERFSLDLHDDKARFNAYRTRTWFLSPLGERIAEGLDDLAASVPIDRWLGNIHLTRNRLRRWNDADQALVEPG